MQTASFLQRTRWETDVSRRMKALLETVPLSSILAQSHGDVSQLPTDTPDAQSNNGRPCHVRVQLHADLSDRSGALPPASMRGPPLRQSRRPHVGTLRRVRLPDRAAKPRIL